MKLTKRIFKGRVEPQVGDKVVVARNTAKGMYSFLLGRTAWVVPYAGYPDRQGRVVISASLENKAGAHAVFPEDLDVIG